MRVGRYAASLFFRKSRQADCVIVASVLLTNALFCLKEETASFDDRLPKLLSSAADGSSSQAKRFSKLSPSFLECMQDVGRHLPVRKSDRELVAHHDLAGRPEWWNEGIRFAPFGTFDPGHWREHSGGRQPQTPQNVSRHRNSHIRARTTLRRGIAA